MMRKLHEELAALVSAGLRLACKKIFNLSFIDFFTALNESPAAPGQKSLSSGELASARI